MFDAGDARRLVEARRLLAEVMDNLDPDAIQAPDAARAVEELAGIERLADAGITLLTAVVTEAGTWSGSEAGSGSTSAEEWLARLAGTSTADARERMRTSRRVRRQPVTRKRLRQGRLSGRQAREVADGAAADPSAQERLCDTAEQRSLAELREEAQRTKAAADPDPEATERRIHSERRARHHRDAEGAFCLSLRGTAAAGAEMLAALRPIQDRMFRQARSEGRQETHDAYLFDAVHAAITGARAGAGDDAADTDAADTDNAATPVGARTSGADAKIIVRVDHAALLRGHPVEGEVCEVAGLGPIPVSVVRHWMTDAFVAVVLTRGTDVATVAHLGRRFTAAQRTALQWRNPTCARAGCGRALGLEYDHRTEWSATNRTAAWDADRLCSRCHDLKTRHGWALVRGTGTRALVPPDDPRHPANAPPATGTDPPRAGADSATVEGHAEPQLSFAG